MPLHASYTANLADAQEYERFVSDTLMYEKKIISGVFQSKHYQTLHGESATGVEIKYDRMFRNTGNLYIETAEKHHESAEMKPSGIYHPNDHWLIVIGDYSTFWVFASSALRIIHSREWCVDVETATSAGFLLPTDKADIYKAWKWEA